MLRSNDDNNQSDLVAGHILGDLSPEETDRLNQAIAETPALAEEVASLREAFALIPYDMPLIEPPAGLKAKIINAASRPTAVPREAPMTDGRSETSATNVVPLAPPQRRNWQRWIPAVSTSIAAVALAALGLNQMQLRQQSQQTIAIQQELKATNTELQRLRNELQTNQNTIARLSQPDMRMYALVGAPSSAESSRASARIFAKPGDRAVMLVAQDLPPLPQEKVYRLWAVATPTAKPMYCGEFRQDDSGTAQWVAPDVACTKTPSQLLITLDAPSDPITSAGPLVVRSST